MKQSCRYKLESYCKAVKKETSWQLSGRPEFEWGNNFLSCPQQCSMPCATLLLSFFFLSSPIISTHPFLPQTQTHTCSYPGWHSTSIVDQTRPHGDSAPVSCLGEHRSTPSLPADPGSLPEESASPARCMIVHQGTILDNVKNLLEFAETLQFIDSVSRSAKARRFWKRNWVLIMNHCHFL